MQIFEDHAEEHREKIQLGGAAAASFVVVLIFLLFSYRWHVVNEKRQLETVANQYATRLARNIDAISATTRALRASVDVHITDGLSLAAMQSQLNVLLTIYPFVSSLQIAPKGVVTFESSIVPGGMPSLGLDLLNDPALKQDALRAANRNDVTLVGPLPLWNGPLGIILRAPVFDRGRQGKPQFWGLVQASSPVTQLLDASGFNDLESNGYRYELWKQDKNTGERTIIKMSETTPLGKTIDFSIDLPDTVWVLALEDTSTPFKYLAWLVILLGPSLVAWGVGTLVRTAQQNRRQFEETIEKQKEHLRRISALVDLYQNIFDAIDAGLVQWSKDQCLETWNLGFEKMYPKLTPHLEKGMTRKSLHRWREQFGETEVSQDWESVGTWYRVLADGRIIMLKRTAMPDGGRLGMHMDMTHSLGDQEYDTDLESRPGPKV